MRRILKLTTISILLCLDLGSVSQAQLVNTKIAFMSERDGNAEIYVMNVDGLNQTRLTNNMSRDGSPSWSPDGTKIAFYSERDGNREIYVMNADGTNQTRLTNNPAIDYPSYPSSWSPDGTKIAFVSNRDGNYEIYVMNADGTNVTRLTNNPADDNQPSWSPDGAKIAFYSHRDGNYEIYVMNANGTNPTRLTNDPGDDSGSSWSPDGTKIVFVSTRNNSSPEIYVMNADGTNPTRLTNNPVTDSVPSWSPDGSKIAFYSERDGNREIYIMNADGTNQTRLTNNVMEDASPSWSPFLPAIQVSPTTVNAGIVNKGSSGTATFTVTNSGGGTLSVSNITSSNPQFTVAPPTPFNLNVGLSQTVTVTFRPTVVGWEKSTLTVTHNGANGPTTTVTANGIGRVTPPSPPAGGSLEKNTKIAFQSTRDGNWEIYTMLTDGTNQINLTNNPLGDLLPSWSPDGTKIAFVSNRDGNNEIYVMKADGSNQTRLFTNSASDGAPSWSPDGTKIAFASDRDGNAEIYVMNADGTNQRRLTNNSINDMAPSWSPDGTKIVFTTGHVYVMNADGTNQIRLTNTGSEEWASWSPDGTKIAFDSGRSGNREIYVMNADGTNQTLLTNNPAYDSVPSWSPDGTKIAFYSTRDGNEEIHVMNADGTNQVNLTKNGASDGKPSWSTFLDVAFVIISTNPPTDPHTVNMGNMNIGSSGTATFTVTNSGSRALFVSNITSSNAQFSVSPMNFNLAIGLSQTVTVTFRPTVVGWERSTATIAHDGINGPTTTVTANGIGRITPPSPPPNGSLEKNTKIAFASFRDGNGEIYVMNADGTNPIRHTDNSTKDDHSSWSPDGKKIAFQSNRDGNWEIYVMNADGTNQIRLTNNTGRNNYNPHWSPKEPKIIFASDRDGNGEIYVMNSDGTNQTRLTYDPTDDYHPSWSPDSMKIAFNSQRHANVPQIFVANVDGTNLTKPIRLTDKLVKLASDVFPRWSPDGTKIAFWSDRAGGSEIYVMNADGTNQSQLTYNSAGDEVPSWSPDGTKIAFWSARDAGQNQIYVMNADGTVQTRLDQPSYNYHPSWSPFLPPSAFISLTSLNPSTKGQGATNQNITITGTNFQSNTTVAFSGTGITVNSITSNSSTQLTANISIDSNATLGSRDITATNPGIAFATLNNALTINQTPVIASLNPANRGQEATNQNIVITGTGFQQNATVVFSGTGITVNSTTFNSATQLTVNISIASNATADSRNITITNPDAGVGVGAGLFTITSAPIITSLNPSSRGQGATNQNITITGTGFQQNAIVSFSGTGITVNTTTFNSATQLTVNISIASNATTDQRNITITNPDAGVGTLNNALTITPPPIPTVLNPSSRGQGAINQNIVITGTGFQQNAIASFSGTGITVNSTTFNSATQLTVNINIASNAMTDQRNITITNPDAGVGTLNNALTITSAPIPTILNPNSRGQGAANQNIVITGTGFQQNATVLFSGTGIMVNSTTFNSSTQLTVNISIVSSADTTNPRNITITNPDAGVGTLNNAFTINPAPVITSLNPNSRGQGATNQNIVITGTGFQQNATVLFSGTGITVNSTTFNSATQLTVNISIAANATADQRNITITNPDAGIGTGTGLFTINPTPIINSLNPQRKWQGVANQNITISGANFQASATALFSGTGIIVNSTTFNNPNQITVNISITTNATGSRHLTITNSDAGSNTKNDAFKIQTVSASNSSISVSPATITADGTAPTTLTLTLKDEDNLPISDKTVSASSISVSGTDNSLSPPQPAPTDANGQTLLTLKSTKAETKTITAIIDSVNLQIAVIFISGPPDSTKTQTKLPEPPIYVDDANGVMVVITLKDKYENLITGREITVNPPTIEPNAGVISLSSPLKLTPSVEGKISLPIKNSKAEKKSISITVDNISLPKTDIDFRPGQPEIITISSDKDKTPWYVGEVAKIKVMIEDKYKNPIKDATLAITATPESAVEATTPVINNNDGSYSTEYKAKTSDVKVNLAIKATAPSFPSKSGSFELNILNRQPTFSSIKPTEPYLIDEGKSLNIELKTEDPDNDKITLTSTPLANSTFEAATSFDLASGKIIATGKFVFAPNHSQAGVQKITFTADDAKTNGKVSKEITIQVNGKPEFTTIGDRPLSLEPLKFEVAENQQLNIPIVAKDPNNDPIIYSAESLPQGAIIEGQTLKWKPDFNTVKRLEGSKKFLIKLKISDGKLDAFQELEITVKHVGPESVVLKLDSNKLVADGKSTMNLEIVPRDINGNLVDDEEIALKLDPDLGSLSSSKVTFDGTKRKYPAIYTAPDKMGEVVIIATTSNGKTDTKEIELISPMRVIISGSPATKEGDKITVSLLAASKGTASFSILGILKASNVPMTEVEPGKYEGSYLVEPGDTIDSILKVSFKDAAGDVSIDESQKVTINVPPDFSLSSLNNILIQEAKAGGTAVFIINIQPKGDFKQKVTLETVGLPSEIRAELSPKELTPPNFTSQLTLGVLPNAPLEEYQFKVLGISADKSSRELSLRVKVTEKPKPIIIVRAEPNNIKLGEQLNILGSLIFPKGTSPKETAIDLIYTLPKGVEKSKEIVKTTGANEELIYKSKYTPDIASDSIGKWKIDASWQGNNEFSFASQSTTFEVKKGEALINFEPLIPQTQNFGEELQIIGRLKNKLGEFDKALSNQKITILIKPPDSAAATPKTIITDEKGFFEDKDKIKLNKEGIWEISASWEGNESYEKAIPIKSDISVIKPLPKAIIVLGGGNEEENPAWNKFGGLANYVYKILKGRKLSDDDIYYLSPTLKRTLAIDEATSESALEFAITQWAAERVGQHVPLFIYLLSHNLDDKFILEKRGAAEKYLTPDKLNEWLDKLDTLKKGTPVTIIIEACHSGNFITKKVAGKSILSKPGRVIIASASEDRQALIEGASLLSFTRLFFGKILKNKDIKSAFLESREGIRVSRSLQSPQIDANGDGTANDPIRDFPATENRFIPLDVTFLPPVPEIKEISKPQQLKIGETKATISVKLTGVNISRVLGTIIPPDYNPEKSFSSWTEVDFETIEFQKKAEGEYEASYDKFIQPGIYTIMVNAENPEGNATPVETSVEVPEGPTVLPFPWDVNKDGTVDIFDLVIVANNFDKTITAPIDPNPDVDGNGKVDIFDLVLVATHFGEKSTPKAAPVRDYASQENISDMVSDVNLLTRLRDLLKSIQKANSGVLNAIAELERLIKIAKNIPSKTKLLANYPNPFNPETWIPYQLSKASEVEIRIYDVSGRLVRRLSLGHKGAGMYIPKGKAAYWDGRNEMGERVASGVYFYQLQAGSFSDMRKMLMVK